MKNVYVSYTILAMFEVPDETTPDEIEQMIEDHAVESGFNDRVNDIEWEILPEEM